MNDLERRQYEMMLRVSEFGAIHIADLPANSLGGESLVAVREVIENLKEFDSNHLSHRTSKRRNTTITASAREALLEDLRLIARCARAMARRVPAIDDKFRLPKRMSDHALAAMARTFAADADPFSAEFVRYEMPANFLEDLKADIAAFEQASQNRTALGMNATASADAIDDAIATGLDAVRDLDAVVRVKYRDDAATLAAWTRASHVERPARAAKAAAATATTA